MVVKALPKNSTMFQRVMLINKALAVSVFMAQSAKLIARSASLKLFIAPMNSAVKRRIKKLRTSSIQQPSNTLSIIRLDSQSTMR